MTPGPRRDLIAQVASRIRLLPRRHVRRVGVDGVDGAGKTFFADELAQVLDEAGESVIRASVDGFHRPRDERYRLGRDSPEGFFRDSYDYVALKAELLDRLSPGGDMRFRRAVYDVECEERLETAQELAPPSAILVFDGIFLHRPELRDYWDLSIYLEVPFEISIPRGAARGSGPADSLAEGNRRYVEGQRIYIKECDPRARASIVIDNTDLEVPKVLS